MNRRLILKATATAVSTAIAIATQEHSSHLVQGISECIACHSLLLSLVVHTHKKKNKKKR